jgi:hypothetical protein
LDSDFRPVILPSYDQELIQPVYATTSRKLQDPTARRLENFWWHVIGVDRRHLNLLSGPLLAWLYENISLGPTFVPLKGRLNRWEGPDVSLTKVSSVWICIL